MKVSPLLPALMIAEVAVPTSSQMAKLTCVVAKGTKGQDGPLPFQVGEERPLWLGRFLGQVILRTNRPTSP